MQDTTPDSALDKLLALLDTAAPGRPSQLARAGLTSDLGRHPFVLPPATPVWRHARNTRRLEPASYRGEALRLVAWEPASASFLMPGDGGDAPPRSRRGPALTLTREAADDDLLVVFLADLSAMRTAPRTS